MRNLMTLDYVQPTRNFSLAYVILDSIFIVGFLALLFLSKRRLTAIWALLGGVLYWVVDFGIFYLATGSRQIYSYLLSSSSELTLLGAGGTGLILFWMSMSYGILDFAFIWLWLSKDKHALDFSLLIVAWWIACPLLASFINGLDPNILCFMTTRSTSKYHGIMGLILIVGYAIVIVMNIFKKNGEQIPVLRLFIIGFMAQFLWEFLLYIFGVRSQNYDNDLGRELSTLLTDSLLETNLGMPYIYFIHKELAKHYHEDLSRNIPSNMAM